MKLLRPLNYYQFSQALQLFILYGVQLAIFPFAAMSEFLLYVVHDTINKRGRPWQFAQELMLVMLKRIDDAGDLKKPAGIRTRVRTAVGPLFEMLHIYMVWLGSAKHIHILFGA